MKALQNLLWTIAYVVVVGGGLILFWAGALAGLVFEELGIIRPDQSVLDAFR